MFVVSWLGINIHNTYLHTKLIKIAFKSCYCSMRQRSKSPKFKEKLKIQEKTLKTQWNNSKLKEKTQNSRKKLNFSAFSESCDVKKVAKKAWSSSQELALSLLTTTSLAALKSRRKGKELLSAWLQLSGWLLLTRSLEWTCSRPLLPVDLLVFIYLQRVKKLVLCLFVRR